MHPSSQPLTEALTLVREEPSLVAHIDQEHQDFLSRPLTKRIEHTLADGQWDSSLYVRWVVYDFRADLTKAEAQAFSRALKDLRDGDRIQVRRKASWSHPGIAIALSIEAGGQPWQTSYSARVANRKCLYEQEAKGKPWPVLAGGSRGGKSVRGGQGPIWGEFQVNEDGERVYVNGDVYKNGKIRAGKPGQLVADTAKPEMQGGSFYYSKSPGTNKLPTDPALKKQAVKNAAKARRKGTMPPALPEDLQGTLAWLESR